MKMTTFGRLATAVATASIAACAVAGQTDPLYEVVNGVEWKYYIYYEWASVPDYADGCAYAVAPANMSALPPDIEIPNMLGGRLVRSIDSVVFRDCSRLKSVAIPDGVKIIYAWTFENCNNMTNLIIGSGVTNIVLEAFRGCSSLTNLTIPGNVKEIGGYAFLDCNSLTNLVLCHGIEKINHDAFGGCSSLTSVTIPDSVKILGEDTFYGCTSLANLIVGKNVTSIGAYSSRGCVLTNVTMRGDAPIPASIGAKLRKRGEKDSSFVYIPRTAKGYELVKKPMNGYEEVDTWNGFIVRYYDLPASGAAVSVGDAAVEFAPTADGRTRTAAVAQGTKAEDIKISVGGVDVTAGYRVSVEGTTATVVLKSPFETGAADGGASGTPRPTGGGAPWTDNGDGTVALAVAVVPGLYYSAAGAASLEELQALTPPAAASPAKAGDKLSVPKVDGAQGFYKVWVGEAPF